MISRSTLAVSVLICFAGCGYHTNNRSGLLPKTVRTIAIPAFTSLTTNYKLPDALPNAIAHELTERSRFQVVADADQADAVLTGTINRLIRAPSLSDPTTGKTTSVQIILIMSLKLTERSTSRVLFARPNLLVKETYEVATDPHQLFDESSPAFQRLNQTVARNIVSSILEDF